jgi:hypothetical protein
VGNKRVFIDSGYTVSIFEKQTSAYSRYFLLYPDIETSFIEGSHYGLHYSSAGANIAEALTKRSL